MGARRVESAANTTYIRILRVLILNRFFWPDECATALLATQLASDFVAAGHEVYVVCSRFRYDLSSARLPASEVYNGIQIRRLWSTHFGRNSTWKRLSDLCSFQVSLRILGIWCCRPDAILALTDPPMLLNSAAWISSFRGGKLYNHVCDLYPDIAESLGALRPGSLAARWFGWRSLRALARCEKIFALGDVMAERLHQKGVAKERILVVPPWTDGERIAPLAHSQNKWRREQGISEGTIVAMYSGNMGRGHGFETILQGIELLAPHENIAFLFVGTGAQRDEIERIAIEKGLRSVRMLPFQSMKRLRESLSAADIHLVSQDPRTVGLIVPSKFSGAIASERPVVFVGSARAEIAECIVKHNCGRVVEDGQPQLFADALLELAQDSRLRTELGRNARKIFELEYDRKLVVKKIIDAMTS